VYANNVLQDFQLNALEKENPEYLALLNEYRDGIMLFELMDRNVWSKATKDTLGLQAFYDGHKEKYKWDAGFAGGVYRFNTKELADKAVALLNKQGVMSEQRLQTELQVDPKSGFLSGQEGRYEWDRFTEVPRAQLVSGKASVPQKNADGSYTVVYVKSDLPAGQQKTLEEARGYAVADYQDSLEKAWNEMLRTKYPVVVNDKVLQSIVQK
jgi:peptidyl-prolyl cis-trans isomerase SurA